MQARDRRLRHWERPHLRIAAEQAILSNRRRTMRAVIRTHRRRMAEGMAAAMEARVEVCFRAALPIFHASIETASHDLGLGGTVHGITHLGETIGLGDLGGDNLLTDVLDAPSAILSGNTGTLLTDLVHDVGNTVEATGNLVNGVGDDLSSPNGILSVAGLVNGLLDGEGGPGEGGLLENIVNTNAHGGDDGHNHLLDVNVGDLGTGLSLGELNVLDGGSIQVPLVDGLHADALSGLVQNGPLAQVLDIGDVGGGALPDIGGITQLLPDILDHNNGHFLLS